MVAKRTNRGHHASGIMHGQNGITVTLLHSFLRCQIHTKTYIYSKKCSDLSKLYYKQKDDRDTRNGFWPFWDFWDRTTVKTEKLTLKPKADFIGTPYRGVKRLPKVAMRMRRGRRGDEVVVVVESLHAGAKQKRNLFRCT